MGKLHLLVACGLLLLCASGRAVPDDRSEAPAAKSTSVTGPNEAAPAHSDAPETWVLTSEGLGPLRIGMTLAEIAAAAGPDSDPEAVGGPEPESCDQFRPERAPDGVIVMVQDGRLTRISLGEGSRIATDRGIRVGDPAARVRAAYGSSLTEMPHEYIEAPAAYFTHWDGNVRPGEGGYVEDPAARGIRYETDERKRVTLIHGGGTSIQYVEGCL
ncbi:MAG TPA: hypothetical protein VGC46_10845 [Allosphingosinicella sp.]